MPAPSARRPRDLLTDAVLGQLHGADLDAAPDPRALARDIAVLREAGYLSVTLPAARGGLDCTLRQAACGQRRLAGTAPLTALAVTAHLYWTGAAADALRSGDDSMTWILDAAADGALFAGGHGTPGRDLTFASPGSRCVLADGGCQFETAGVTSSITPGWDWLAVHGLTGVAPPQDDGPLPRRSAVLAFAPRRGVLGVAPPGDADDDECRVVRVLPAGAPSDVFTTSAVGWGCALLASVEFSAARLAFRQAVAIAPCPGTVDPGTGAAGHPLDRWPVAEAGLRLSALKERIAAVTHPWPRVPEPGPDLGGQHVISLYAMRHEVAEGSAAVRRLTARIPSARGAAVTPLR
jgi:hypothetical protein